MVTMLSLERIPLSRDQSLSSGLRLVWVEFSLLKVYVRGLVITYALSSRIKSKLIILFLVTILGSYFWSLQDHVVDHMRT